MKQVSSQLQAHLETGATSLCYCWRLSLSSGVTLGFTDHDLPLSFDGTVFEAASGFSASEIQSSLGLSVDNLEASGALSSAAISEAALQAGDFDGAQIEVWKVNWLDVSMRILERKGHLGEVSYGQGAFKAEVRGLAHQLNQKKGRLYLHSCDARLGDGRCGVNLAPLRVAAVVVSVAEHKLVLSGLAAFAEDWFSRGQVEFSAGRSLSIQRHRVVNGIVTLELWARPQFMVSNGAAVFVTAGCDKQLSTCRAKFGNAVNFQGFPHMPGNDFVASVAQSSDGKLDGGRLFS